MSETKCWAVEVERVLEAVVYVEAPDFKAAHDRVREALQKDGLEDYEMSPCADTYYPIEITGIPSHVEYLPADGSDWKINAPTPAR